MMSSIDSRSPSAAMPDASGGRLTIDLEAIAANYRQMKSAAGLARTSAVIKADGYGLGALHVAMRLVAEGCDLFFVAHLNEALALRDAASPVLDRCEIAVFNGPPPGTEAIFAERKIVPVLNSLADIERWVSLCRERGTRLPAYIHVDTGMNRLGLSPAEVGEYAASNALRNAFQLEAVMSHLACADDPDHPMNVDQLTRFREHLTHFGGARASLANSAATLTGRPYLFDMVRPGIGLYGGNPFADKENPMRRTVTLQGRVLQVRRIDKGEAVGYGATYRTDSPRRLATVSAGYADGYFRVLGNKARASIAGVSLPVVGRVSMDLITLDVTQAPEGAVEPGGYVELIGQDVTIDELGTAAGSFAYEVLTSLGHRYARHYV